MRFQTPLIPATLIRRYKRFLADVRLDDGREVTAHCANPGKMIGLNMPGLKIWVEPNDDPKRKLNYSWRLASLDDGSMVGIDTSLPNKLVDEALAKKLVKPLADYPDVRREVPYGDKSRVDFLLQGVGKPDVYLEIKNAHLRRTDDWAEFPDSVTARGARHMDELAEMVVQGHRAVVLFVVQHTGCNRFRVSGDLDPKYAAAFEAARAVGVEVLVYDTIIDTETVVLGKEIPLGSTLQT